MAKFKVGDKVQLGEDDFVYEVVYVNDKLTEIYSTQQYCVRYLQDNALRVAGESLMRIANKIWYVVDTDTREILLTRHYPIKIEDNEDDGVIRIIDINISDRNGQIVDWWYKNKHSNIEIREVDVKV